MIPIPKPGQFMADPETSRLLKRLARISGHTPEKLLRLLLRSPRIQVFITTAIRDNELTPEERVQFNRAFQGPEVTTVDVDEDGV